MRLMLVITIDHHGREPALCSAHVSSWPLMHDLQRHRRNYRYVQRFTMISRLDHYSPPMIRSVLAIAPNVYLARVQATIQIIGQIGLPISSGHLPTLSWACRTYCNDCPGIALVSNSSISNINTELPPPRLRGSLP